MELERAPQVQNLCLEPGVIENNGDGNQTLNLWLRVQLYFLHTHFMVFTFVPDP